MLSLIIVVTIIYYDTKSSSIDFVIIVDALFISSPFIINAYFELWEKFLSCLVEPNVYLVRKRISEENENLEWAFIPGKCSVRVLNKVSGVGIGACFWDPAKP